MTWKGTKITTGLNHSTGKRKIVNRGHTNYMTNVRRATSASSSRRPLSHPVSFSLPPRSLSLSLYHGAPSSLSPAVRPSLGQQARAVARR
uniref:Uncharacterized protein n=1 Tax=Arundo donax TaxID=35708 RepID=A0A0A9CQF3_ARUDO